MDMNLYLVRILVKLVIYKNDVNENQKKIFTLIYLLAYCTFDHCKANRHIPDLQFTNEFYGADDTDETNDNCY